jgi:hypothetical protein
LKGSGIWRLLLDQFAGKGDKQAGNIILPAGEAGRSGPAASYQTALTAFVTETSESLASRDFQMIAPSAAPISGATQKSQSWLSAPFQQKRRRRVERAGLKDVFVTGIETRWMSVRPRPMAIGAKPAGTDGRRRAKNDDKEDLVNQLTMNTV